MQVPTARVFEIFGAASRNLTVCSTTGNATAREAVSLRPSDRLDPGKLLLVLDICSLECLVWMTRRHTSRQVCQQSHMRRTRSNFHVCDPSCTRPMRVARATWCIAAPFAKTQSRYVQSYGLHETRTSTCYCRTTAEVTYISGSYPHLTRPVGRETKPPGTKPCAWNAAPSASAPCTIPTEVFMVLWR